MQILKNKVAAVLAADASAVGVLPEPYVTAVGLKNPSLKPRVSLTNEWNSLCSAEGGQLVTGVTVVRKEFAQQNPQVVQEFMAQQKASVTAVNADPETAGQLVAAAGIIESPVAAAKAIPNCNLVYIEGAEMKAALDGYLKALFAQDPASVGAALPAESFFMM